MPLAVTHVLSSIISVDIFRDYFYKHKRFITRNTLLLAGLGGLLPDIDIPISIILSSLGENVSPLLQHGGITHTPLFALFFLVPGLILWKKNKHKQAWYFFVVFFGIMLHIFLDWLLGGGAYEGVMWLFPFSMSAWKIHLLKLVPSGNIPAALDAIILLAWLWHEEIKHRISDFI